MSAVAVFDLLQPRAFIYGRIIRLDSALGPNQSSLTPDTIPGCVQAVYEEVRLRDRFVRYAIPGRCFVSW